MSNAKILADLYANVSVEAKKFMKTGDKMMAKADLLNAKIQVTNDSISVSFW